MLYMQEGRYSPEEIMEYMKEHNIFPGLDVVSVNSSDFNNGLGPDYPYWYDINHPITGEHLYAVRGYMGDGTGGNYGCYYAEYVDKNGNYYNYVHQFHERSVHIEEKNIGKQQFEDKQLKEKENFADIVNEYKKDHPDSEEQQLERDNKYYQELTRKQDSGENLTKIEKYLLEKNNEGKTESFDERSWQSDKKQGSSSPTIANSGDKLHDKHKQFFESNGNNHDVIEEKVNSETSTESNEMGKIGHNGQSNSIT